MNEAIYLSDVEIEEHYQQEQPWSRPYSKGLQMLERDFHYKDDLIDITIAKNSVWDGASIPKIFWFTTVSTYSPSFIKASLVHDYLYKTGLYDKKTADKVFYKILLECGVGKYTAWKMYKAVQVGGILPYRKWRKLCV